MDRRTLRTRIGLAALTIPALLALAPAAVMAAPPDVCATQVAASLTSYKITEAAITDGGGAGTPTGETFTLPDGTRTITVSNFTDGDNTTAGSFDWASNFPVYAVIVQTGNSPKNIVEYGESGSTGAAGVTIPAGQGNENGNDWRIAFCYVPAEEPSPSTSIAPTPSGSIGGETDAPTQPPTDSLAAASTASAGDLRVVLLALAVVLGLALLAPTPKRSRSR